LEKKEKKKKKIDCLVLNIVITKQNNNREKKIEKLLCIGCYSMFNFGGLIYVEIP
jgi:hypothetical protein